ncbi:hypothetical protein LRR81_12845 [Metabacillus sp. GX 13764]|uniref:hypothetical protein n=1 Tax=Metabacillus kandeliae TaxID=2900151 RepID=UPI001E536B90|nr:hypothetical protein [Metabacillus kandeliae]MCD7035127.1 hypothetical protein [Metabacillus kandeliae]
MGNTKKLKHRNIVAGITGPYFILMTAISMRNPQINLVWFLAATLLYIGVVYSVFYTGKKYKMAGYLSLALTVVTAIWALIID